MAAQYLGVAVFDVDPVASSTNDWRFKGLAIGFVVLMNGLQCLGIKHGVRVQNTFGVLKILLVAYTIGLGVYGLAKDTSILSHTFASPFDDTSLAGVLPGVVAVLWAFDGKGACRSQCKAYSSLYLGHNNRLEQCGVHLGRAKESPCAATHPNPCYLRRHCCVLACAHLIPVSTPLLLGGPQWLYLVTMVMIFLTEPRCL